MSKFKIIQIKKPVRLEVDKTYGISVDCDGVVAIKEMIGWGEHNPIFSKTIYNSGGKK